MARQSIHLCGQDIDTPGHICAFFDSREEEYDTLIPYFSEGIERGDQILNVLDTVRLSDHRRRLAAAGVPLNDGRVHVASSEDTYLADGHFDMMRMVGFVESTLARAADNGQRVRTAGWMDWMYREAPGTELALEYEARMNLLLPTFDCTFMCIYDLAKLPGTMLVDILATHPYVILKGRIRENSFFVSPDVYLAELLSRKQHGSGRSA